MFEKYIITDHARKRYAERVNFDAKNIDRKIKVDLKMTNAKKIFNIDGCRHIFTQNGKEFIFGKTSSQIWILKTVIKRTRPDQEKAIARYTNQKLNACMA